MAAYPARFQNDDCECQKHNGLQVIIHITLRLQCITNALTLRL